MSGGKKKRKDIAQGEAKANAFTQQGVAALQPYAQAGIPATNQLSALLGISGDQGAANSNFTNSLFYQGGENAFNTERDAINSGLSDQGLLYSQARINGVEDARQRNFQNAFSQYLGANQGLAGIGLQGAGGQANLYGQQGQNALNAGFQTANTRQGVLGALGQVASIGRSVAGGFGGFG